MQTAIKVEQLSKSYGNLLAIDQISLSVKYGHRLRAAWRKRRREKYND